MKKEKIKAFGFIEAIVTRADGTEFVHHSEKNTIAPAFLDKLAEISLAFIDISLTASLFTERANPPDAFGSGIRVNTDFGASPGIWSMICSISKPTTTSVRTTGVIDGIAGTVSFADLVRYGGAGLGFYLATPTSWANLVMAAEDTLTINWTITFQEG